MPLIQVFIIQIVLLVVLIISYFFFPDAELYIFSGGVVSEGFLLRSFFKVRSKKRQAGEFRSDIMRIKEFEGRRDIVRAKLEYGKLLTKYKGEYSYIHLIQECLSRLENPK